MDNLLTQLRSRRTTSTPIQSGVTPKAQLNSPKEGIGIGLWIIVGILVLLGGLFFNESFGVAFSFGIESGFLVAVLYWLWPIISFFLKTVRYGRFPNAYFLNTFSASQKIISCIVLAFGFVELLNYGIPYFHVLNLNPPNVHSSHHHGHAHQSIPPKTYFDILHFAIAWFFTTLGFSLFFGRILSRRKPTLAKGLPFKKTKLKLVPKKALKRVFNLWIGESTGWLAKLRHGAGIAPKQAVTLSSTDAAQNILILGAIGSGKTTRAVHPLLLQCLDQDCGGLIFDIKGDFKNTVYTFMQKTNKSIITIGVKQTPIDLLRGLTPEVAASFLKSVFILNARASLDNFWVDTATELCRNSLGVLSFFPEWYSLQGLYQYIFEPSLREEINNQTNILMGSLDTKQQRLLKSYQNYYAVIYSKFEDKVKSNVHATIAQVLSPFNHPDLVDAFCTQSDNNASLQSVINGDVFLVDLPLATWGLGAKVIYTFIKLRFFNVMQQRLQEPSLNQERPVFFLCDEFQEIVSANRDGLSDLNFWDKSRSSKTIGIISAQSISSFYAAIGERDIANALLQNFRQKICFKTDDQTTIDTLNRLLGRIEMERLSYSVQEGSGSHPNQFFDSTHKSSSESLTLVDKPVLDAQLFRQLGQNQAVALLTLDGVSRDDVLNMMPVFV